MSKEFVEKLKKFLVLTETLETLQKAELSKRIDRQDKYGLSTNQSRKIRYNNESGVNKPYAMGSGISSQGYTVRGAMRTTSPEGNQGQSFRQPQGGPDYDRELARKKAKNTLKELKQMPKPNLPKTEKSESDEVEGVAIPKELHEHKSTVPYDHPHRELAAKFVSAVASKNKREGMRLSDKYLGSSYLSGEGSKTTKEAYAKIPDVKKAISPSIVSTPIVQNRVTSTEPKTVNSPLVIHSSDKLKKMVNLLKSKKV